MEVAGLFALAGPVSLAEPFGSGHINDTYRVVAGGQEYVLQRINTDIFRDPAGLMDNVDRVCRHLASKRTGHLTVVPARSGALWASHEGEAWRVYERVLGVRSYDQIETAEQARQVGEAFGRFQEQLSDLPPPRLVETIPDFHNTARRYERFEAAVAADSHGRVPECAAEVQALRRREPLSRVLAERGLPERIVHNDTKLNNVLFSEATGDALCVVDLDTVMPGLVAADFGDMVRTATNTGAEDDQDLSRVGCDRDIFAALARGYLSAARGFLTKAEVDTLALSGQVLTYELVLRFLTDYLEGDPYFKTHRPRHNLERARAQLRLVESLEEQAAELERVVREAAGS